MERKITTGTIARVGVLGAIASILFFYEIPWGLGFYKLDFSTLPALLGGFAMGPVPGFLIVLIKDATGLFHTTSRGVGELADLIMSTAFVVTASVYYERTHSRKGAVIGMTLGAILMTVLGALTNYYILIPFFVSFMGWPEEAVIQSIATVIPAVNSFESLVVFATTPFNIVKGLILSLAAFYMYMPLRPLLRGKKV